MNIFFKTLLFFGVTQAVAASLPSEVDEHTIQVFRGLIPVFSQQELAVQQMRQCLSVREQENIQLREQVQWYVAALAGWEQWAGGVEGYHYYLDGKYASLERAFSALKQKHELLECAHTSFQEKHSTCELLHVIAQRSLAYIWSPEASALGNGVGGMMHRPTLGADESESSLELNFDWAATQKEPKSKES